MSPCPWEGDGSSFDVPNAGLFLCAWANGKHPLPCTAYLHIHLCTLLALLAPQLDDALPGVLRASIQIAAISQAYWRPGHCTQPL